MPPETMTRPQVTNRTNHKGGEFTEEQFMANASAYYDNRPLIDAIVRVEPEKRADAIKAANSAIEALKLQEESGSGFTPPSSLGFGSENAASIAAAVLGDRQSLQKVRTKYSNLGKPS